MPIVLPESDEEGLILVTKKHSSSVMKVMKKRGERWLPVTAGSQSVKAMKKVKTTVTKASATAKKKTMTKKASAKAKANKVSHVQPMKMKKATAKENNKHMKKKSMAVSKTTNLMTKIDENRLVSFMKTMKPTPMPSKVMEATFMPVGGAWPDHIMEFFSPPRVIDACQKLGLRGSVSCDLLTGWDLSTPEDQAKAMAQLVTKQPACLILSPPCTFFSTLMDSNWSGRTGGHHSSKKEGFGR
jgi:hypothetical protein